MTERADAVVVGARCAGAATAVALARAGRRVVVLDRVRFPADTISTHLLWPSGVAELQALGALERVRAVGAPRLTEAFAAGPGHEIRTGWTPVDGIDHAWCVRRTGLDAALVATAREAGAEVREGVRVTDVLREADGRVVGVRWSDDDGRPSEVRASLVVGADGRRSTVARALGVTEPARSSASGRACFYAYWHDDRDDLRHVAAMWREGPELGTAFPCDDGLVLCLLQPPAARADEFRGDLEGAYRTTIARLPGLAERLSGCELATKVRSATGIESWFRSSAGPGWALAGDAGHFKDPVTAQGIRDALHYGRRLGAAVAPVLDDPVALDAAVRGWERHRERECLPVYQWTNLLARGEAMTPLEIELGWLAARRPRVARQVADVYARTRPPSAVMPARRFVWLTARALTRPGADRVAVLRSARRDVAGAAADAHERVLVRFVRDGRRGRRLDLVPRRAADSATP